MSDFKPDDLGYANDPYASRAELTTWSSGRDYGAPMNPDIAGSIVGGVATLASVGIGAVLKNQQEKKARQQAAFQAKQQEKTLELQAKLAQSLPTSGSGTPWGLILGGGLAVVVLVGGIGTGIWYFRKGKEPEGVEE